MFLFDSFLRKEVCADRRKRQEGRSARIAAFEQADRALRVRLPVDDDILHRRAERRFRGRDIFLGKLHQRRNRAVDAAQTAVFMLAHDDAHRAVEAFVFLCKVAQHRKAAARLLHLKFFLRKLVLPVFDAAAARIKLEPVAGQHVSEA